MANSNSAVSRRMISLRPGDVITALGCCLDCNKMNILVLGRQGDGFFDFSLKSQIIGILRDPEGPYCWDERKMRFVSKDGKVVHHHIDKTAVIQEAAGLVELGWFRQLPQYGTARHRISPRGLMGPIAEPGILAKMKAMLEGAQNNEDHVAGVSLAIDMIFSGHEYLLDERRMRLLHVLINTSGEIRSKRVRGSDPFDLAAMLGGMDLGDLDSPDSLRSIVGMMGGRRMREAFAG